MIADTCENCGKDIRFSTSDEAFFKKIDVPAPSHCADCILQNIYAYRNERSFYSRDCDLCGKHIISMISPDSKYKVYCPDCWWSDKWDATGFEKDIDFSMPFFTQLEKLLEKTPIINLIIGNSENAEYTNYCLSNKGCYMIAASDYNKDCYYSTYIFKCHDAVDCLFLNECEKVYNLIDCKNCYASAYLQKCQTCNDCLFCYSCRNLSDCIGCVNLVGKKYHIFNKPYLKEDYLKKKNELQLTVENIEKFKVSFEQLKLKYPVKYAELDNCIESSGDYLSRCKNCVNCFDLIESQDMKDSVLGIKAKDGLYNVGIPNSELVYQTAANPENYKIKFSAFVWPKSSELEYCLFPRISKNCFGCVSVYRKEYCILNKQYSRGEYEKNLEKIKQHMKKEREYGNFFPTAMSPFAYNETIAQEYFPLTEQQAKEKGYKWINKEPRGNSSHPDALLCVSCDRNYKLIKQELNFYKNMKLPTPKKCPDCRHAERMKLRNPRRLWGRKCTKCGTQMQSTYAPDRPEIVYCEKCYLGAIY